MLGVTFISRGNRTCGFCVVVPTTPYVKFLNFVIFDSVHNRLSCCGIDERLTYCLLAELSQELSTTAVCRFCIGGDFACAVMGAIDID